MPQEFNVWIARTDGATRVRVSGLNNTEWLLRRLSNFFVFKSSEGTREASNTSEFTFCVPHRGQLWATGFERILAGIHEVNVISETQSQPGQMNVRDQQ
jgi:hypothetical protein